MILEYFKASLSFNSHQDILLIFMQLRESATMLFSPLMHQSWVPSSWSKSLYLWTLSIDAAFIFNKFKWSAHVIIFCPNSMFLCSLSDSIMDSDSYSAIVKLYCASDSLQLKKAKVVLSSVITLPNCTLLACI